MKKALFIIFGFCSLAWYGSASAHDVERIYVLANQVAFSNNNVFVFHENDWQQVSAIFSDENGLFVEAAQPNPETWYCPACRTTHSDSTGGFPKNKR